MSYFLQNFLQNKFVIWNSFNLDELGERCKNMYQGKHRLLDEQGDNIPKAITEKDKKCKKHKNRRLL